MVTSRLFLSLIPDTKNQASHSRILKAIKSWTVVKALERTLHGDVMQHQNYTHTQLLGILSIIRVLLLNITFVEPKQ